MLTRTSSVTMALFLCAATASSVDIKNLLDSRLSEHNPNPEQNTNMAQLPSTGEEQWKIRQARRIFQQKQALTGTSVEPGCRDDPPMKGESVMLLRAPQATHQRAIRRISALLPDLTFTIRRQTLHTNAATRRSVIAAR
jgi:hypothetical protein